MVSHKLVAEAAGLGKMGIHRNIIHPKFGNFILLGTLFIDAEVVQQSRPIDYNPCLECKLCVAACPVEAMTLVTANDPDKPRRKKAKLDEQICLGCGVCAAACDRGGVFVLDASAVYRLVVVLQAAREREQMADRDLLHLLVHLPLGDRLDDRFVERQESLAVR